MGDVNFSTDNPKDRSSQNSDIAKAPALCFPGYKKKPMPVNCKFFISCAITISLTLSASLRAQKTAPSVSAVTVPFVGCKSDGQVGPEEAPVGNNKIVSISADSAQQLAYYRDKFGFGVLGPRGWHCFGAYGSDGDFLYVSPQPVSRADLFSMDWKGFTGPAIQMTNEYGGTSGRFGVAAIIARVFPSYKEFVHQVMNEDIEAGINPPDTYVFGPYPTDKLMYRGKNVVEYITPPNTEGLGTHSRLMKNSAPIRGAAILVGQTPDLLQLSMRLPKGQRDLAHVIIQQTERDAPHFSNSE